MQEMVCTKESLQLQWSQTGTLAAIVDTISKHPAPKFELQESTAVIGSTRCSRPRRV
eukprot:m.147324 g.147324  ORF g.147324 m.147324 type:complete len:57 (-) comp16258_c1_seq1:3167-3337(-)